MPDRDHRKELLANIEIIRTVVPGFSMSEEQINKFLSKERQELQDSVKNVANVANNKELQNGKKAIMQKYDSSQNTHNAISRNYYHMIRDEKTPEDIEFNRKMFTGINRDDEIGEAVRQNYFVEVLNTNLKINPEEVMNLPMDEKDPYNLEAEKQLLQLSVKYADIGGISMETQNFMNALPGMVLSQELLDKFQPAKDFGQTAGGYFRDHVNWVKSDMFMELPLEYLTYEQIGILSRNPDLVMKYGDGAAKYLNSDLYRRNLVKDAKDFMEKLPDYKEFRIKPEDVTFSANPEFRAKGGYAGRTRVILDGCDAVLALNSTVDPEQFKAVQQKTLDLKNAILSAGEIPSAEDQKKITDAVNAQNKAIYTYRKLPEIDKTQNPQIAEMSETLRLHMSACSQLRDVSLVSDLVNYHKADLEQFNEKHNLLNENLRDLNEVYTGLRSKDEYGRPETLTQLDIYDIRVKNAAILKNIDESFALDQKMSGFEQRRLESIRKQVQAQQKAMDRAVPGMTLDRVLSGRSRQIDITGHTFKTYGNAMSSRKRMTISGEDGSRQNGFFTERTTLSDADFKVGLTQKLKDQFPKCRDDIEAITNAVLSGTDYEQILNTFVTKNGIENIAAIYDVAKEANETFIDQKSTLMGMIFCDDNAIVDQRNVAMSDVAHLLDCEDILAKSTNLTLYQNGREIHGTFMNTAQGYNPDSIEKDSPFLNIKEDCLDHSPALKQIADMQVLDYICGNADRHAGNLMYQFDETGKIIGVMGIDNDCSFSSIDLPTGKGFPLENISYISETMASKLKNVTPEMLKTTLAGNGLTETEINMACTRLTNIKNAVQEGTIPTMADDEFAKHNLSDFIKDDGKCTFHEIKSKINEVINMPQDRRDDIMKQEDSVHKEDVLDLFEKVDPSYAKQDMEPLGNLIDEMQRAEKWVFGGSTEYANAKKALKEIQKATSFIGNSQKLANNKKAYEALHDSYDKLGSLCDKYLKRKEKQGLLNADGKPGRRIAAINRVKEFCKNKTASLAKTLGTTTRMREDRALREEADRLQMSAMNPELAGRLFKQMNEIAANENAAPQMKIKAAQQIKLIGKYMQENHVQPKDCGLDQADLLAAQKTVKIGRLESIKLHPELAQNEPKAPEKQETGLTM